MTREKLEELKLALLEVERERVLAIAKMPTPGRWRACTHSGHYWNFISRSSLFWGGGHLILTMNCQMINRKTKLEICMETHTWWQCNLWIQVVINTTYQKCVAFQSVVMFSLTIWTAEGDSLLLILLDPYGTVLVRPTAARGIRYFM
jgi:hypothetical protein